MKTSPTRSRSSARAAGLLTISAAFFASSLFAADQSSLTSVPTRDSKIVRRWSIPGGPRGVAIGSNGLIYVGLADKQAVAVIDSKSGAVVRELVLDSAEIAATKELVTLRTNRDKTRLYIANGSDESATILSLPDLAVVREITMEGEAIRDAVPDPAGRSLYLLGRRVHVFDADGKKEIRAIDFADPMAIALSSDVTTLAVLGTEDYGNAKATAVALYDTTTINEITRDPLQTDQAVGVALFAANDRALIALSRQSLFEKSLVTRRAKTMATGSDGRMRMAIDFGDLVSSERICLPEGSGPQIAALGPTSDVLLFAERRCSSSGAFSGSDRRVTPASLYGVNAYAVAYDRDRNNLVVTEKAGYLTIYKVPRPAIAH
ncbi:MAG: YncE family protein [Thermoanaerobaculia bacterium]